MPFSPPAQLPLHSGRLLRQPGRCPPKKGYNTQQICRVSRSDIIDCKSFDRRNVIQLRSSFEISRHFFFFQTICQKTDGGFLFTKTLGLGLGVGEITNSLPLEIIIVRMLLCSCFSATIHHTVDYYLLTYLSYRQMLGNPTKRDTRVFLGIESV